MFPLAPHDSFIKLFLGTVQVFAYLRRRYDCQSCELVQFCCRIHRWGLCIALLHASVNISHNASILKHSTGALIDCDWSKDGSGQTASSSSPTVINCILNENLGSISRFDSLGLTTGHVPLLHLVAPAIFAAAGLLASPGTAGRGKRFQLQLQQHALLDFIRELRVEFDRIRKGPLCNELLAVSTLQVFYSTWKSF